MKIKLAKQLMNYFWDADFETLDTQNDQFFIIERLVEKGNFDSLKWLFNNYSEGNIKIVVEKSPNISPAKKHLISIVLK